jgi:hypothetical protein
MKSEEKRFSALLVAFRAGRKQAITTSNAMMLVRSHSRLRPERGLRSRPA